MNIAFFVGSFPLLSETFILNQITGLIDRGHEVDIYAKRILDPPTLHEDVERYGLKEVAFPHGDVVAGGAGSFLHRAAGAAGLLLRGHLDTRVLLRSLNVVHYGREAFACRLFYRAIPFLASPRRYDIVHCHFGPNGRIASDLKRIGALDAKIITTFHGSDITQYLKRKGPGAYNRLFQEGDLFLPISERWKTKLIDLGCSEKKISVHRMGIDTRKFTTDGSLRQGGRSRILSVGRLVPKKGIAHGIRAVTRLLEKFPETEYLIVGDGPLREPLEDMINASNTGGRIRLLGWKTQEEVVELMKSADIFLAPSVTDEKGNQEGLPVVLMEAQALAIPVVSTFHSGIPELIGDGVSGFLLPEGDIEGLEDRLSRLLTDPALGRQLGAEGRRCVLEDFDIGKLNDRLVTLYESVLDRHVDARKACGSPGNGSKTATGNLS